jgi:hypothetical protein
MRTSEVLNRAADLIQERGWAKGSGWCLSGDTGGPLCLEGGLNVAAGYVGAIPVREVVRDYLTSTRPEHISPELGYVIPFAWNDSRKSAAEVIEVLRACAVVEAAKEDAAVPAHA